MRWRILLSIFLGIITIMLSMLGGFYLSNPKYVMASFLCFLLALDTMLFGIGFAQDDGLTIRK